MLTHMASLNQSLVGTKTEPVALSGQIDQQIVVDQTEAAPLQAEINQYTAQIAKISDELERIEKVDTDPARDDRADRCGQWRFEDGARIL